MPTFDESVLDPESLKADLLRTMWAAERATAEMLRAANRVRAALGLPAETLEPWPGALAQDAALARAGWDRLSAPATAPPPTGEVEDPA